jgi:hypothetical protein
VYQKQHPFQKSGPILPMICLPVTMMRRSLMMINLYPERYQKKGNTTNGNDFFKDYL